MDNELDRSSQIGPKMYVELNIDQPQDISIRLLEIMRSLKENLQSLNAYNERPLKASK